MRPQNLRRRRCLFRRVQRLLLTATAMHVIVSSTASAFVPFHAAQSTTLRRRRRSEDALLFNPCFKSPCSFPEQPSRRHSFDLRLHMNTSKRNNHQQQQQQPSQNPPQRILNSDNHSKPSYSSCHNVLQEIRKTKTLAELQELMTSTTTTTTRQSSSSSSSFAVAAAALKQWTILAKQQIGRGAVVVASTVSDSNPQQQEKEETEKPVDQYYYPLVTQWISTIQTQILPETNHNNDYYYEDTNRDNDIDSPYALSDALIGLANLYCINNKSLMLPPPNDDNDKEKEKRLNSSIIPALAQTIWYRLFHKDFFDDEEEDADANDQHYSSYWPPPTRLAQCVIAKERLLLMRQADGGLPVHDTKQRQQQTIVVEELIYQRLTQGDALTQQSPNTLAQLLAVLLQHKDTNRHSMSQAMEEGGKDDGLDDSSNNNNMSELEQQQQESLSALQALIKATARRLRKKNVRTSLSTFQLLNVVTEASRWLSTVGRRSTNSVLCGELKVMIYTLIGKELLFHRNKTGEEALSLFQRAKLWNVAMQLQLEWDDYMVQNIMLLPLSSDSDKTLASDESLTKPISTLQLEERLWHYFAHVHSALVDKNREWMEHMTILCKALVYWRLQHQTSSNIVKQVGLHLHHLVTTQQSSCLQAKHVNAFARAAVLLHRNNENVMEAFLSVMVLDSHHALFKNQHFLSQCTVSELANFGWFVWRSRVIEISGTSGNQKQVRAVVVTLADRLVDHDLLESCTPKEAGRIISTFTDLFGLLEEQANVDNGGTARIANQTAVGRQLLACLFETYGTLLLSMATLSASALSSCIRAYAKASYTSDMGLFDALVYELTRRGTDQITNRQLAQSVWACGKMMAWEDNNVVFSDDDESDDATVTPPPYVTHAASLCHYLVRRSDTLTCQDVSQVLYAVSRLRLEEKTLIEPLAQRVKQLAPILSFREIGNILCAVSNQETRRYDVVYAVTRRLAEANHAMDDSVLPSPQDCSLILSTLARMDVRDEAVFNSISQSLLSQMDVTSSEVISDVLRAHGAVHIAPPQRLMGDWASVKLGVVPAVSKGRAEFDLYEFEDFDDDDVEWDDAYS